MDLPTLAQRLASAPRDRLAAIDETGSITYGDLIDRADRLAEQIGATKELVILSCENSIDWLAAYLAVLRGQHAAFLVPPEARDYQASLAAIFGATLEMSAANGYAPTRLDPGQSGLGQSGLVKPVLDPRLTVLLSTSGSTGSPKSVRLSDENLASNAQSIATYLQLDETERGVVSLPVHYSYGLSIVNSHLWAGACILLTARSLIEPEFWTFCRDAGATSFAGVPHSYDLLSRIDLVAHAPQSLRYFTQAGGRLEPGQVTKFAAIARDNGWRFYVMYGQTEAAPRMAWLPPEALADHVGAIGIAIPGGKLGIRDAQGRDLPPGEEGELVYEGRNVMMGYAITAGDLALGQGPQDLHTGDLARQSEDGFFYITGRMSRFLKIFGNRIGLDEVEGICAAAGFPAVATGNDQKILVVTRQPGVERDIRDLLCARLGLPALAIDVLEMDEYPLLATGKTDYATLKTLLTRSPAESTRETPRAGQSPGRGHARIAVSASADHGGSGLGHPDLGHAAGIGLLLPGEGVPGEVVADEMTMGQMTSVAGRLVQGMETILNIRIDGLDRSFVEMGGDSLSYIQVSLLIESVLGWLPDHWETLSLRELSHKKNLIRQKMLTISIPVLARVTSILAVVLLHTTQLPVGGGTFVLLMLAGYSMARYQMENLTKGATLQFLVSMLGGLLFSYYIIITGLSLWFDDFEWKWFALINNYWPVVPLMAYPYWFISIYAQIVVITAALFLLPPVRYFAKQQPLVLSLLGLGTVSVLMAVFDFGAMSFADRLHHPLGALELVTVGWCISLATDLRSRLITTGIVLGVLLLDWSDLNASTAVHLYGWSTVILWVRAVRLPRALALGILHLGSATMYIYLIHVPAMYFVYHFTSNRLAVFLGVFTICLSGSFAAMWTLKYIDENLGGRFLRAFLLRERDGFTQ